MQEWYTSKDVIGGAWIGWESTLDVDGLALGAATSSAGGETKGISIPHADMRSSTWLELVVFRMIAARPLTSISSLAFFALSSSRPFSSISSCAFFSAAPILTFFCALCLGGRKKLATVYPLPRALSLPSVSSLPKACVSISTGGDNLISPCVSLLLKTFYNIFIQWLINELNNNICNKYS